jgi:branched-chain amino acid transport system ATP-binding protein
LRPYIINRIGIGRTFQDLRLISQLTVKENVLLALHGNPTDNWIKALLPQYFYTSQIKQLEEKAEAILEEYFLSDVINSPAGEISYGQQKLLSIACCVANNAELLLLDEPLAGINPKYRNHIGELLNKLKVCGLTILIIDHNTEIIECLADSIFFLSGGKIETYSSYQNFKTDPNVLEGYL